METPICQVQRLGLAPYEQTWKLQDELAAQIAAGQRPPTLLLLEHPHTYTFGRRGQAHNLLWGEAELAQHGITVHWVDRGGDVTYHGPGQLVGYPLIPLGVVSETAGQGARLPQDVYVGYLRRLEQVLILALASYGVQGKQVPGLTGVWVESGSQERKIAAIGVKVDARGITRHGFALNVAPDMQYWDGIIACGLAGRPLTSLAELLPNPPAMAQVMDVVSQAFGQVFGYQILMR